MNLQSRNPGLSFRVLSIKEQVCFRNERWEASSNSLYDPKPGVSKVHKSSWRTYYNQIECIFYFVIHILLVFTKYLIDTILSLINHFNWFSWRNLWSDLWGIILLVITNFKMSWFKGVLFCVVFKTCTLFSFNLKETPETLKLKQGLLFPHSKSLFIFPS